MTSTPISESSRVDAYVDAVRVTLRQLRYARGVTLQSVADHIGASLSMVSKMETGLDNRALKIQDVVSVCDALDVPPAAVFEYAHTVSLANGGEWWHGGLPADMGYDNRPLKRGR